MNGAPTALTNAKGSKTKPSAVGKKGNVGGKVTPGRQGNMAAGLVLQGLVKPGPGTKKTANLSGKIRPEGAVQINVGPKGSTSAKPQPGSATGGSAKDISAGSGHKGFAPKVRIEGAIKRDSASVIKPNATNTGTK